MGETPPTISSRLRSYTPTARFVKKKKWKRGRERGREKRKKQKKEKEIK